jgi:hypothetical protein
VTIQSPTDLSANGSRLPKRSRVMMSILLTLLLCSGSLFVLFYYATTHPQPNCTIVVRGNRDWDGIELAVQGGALEKPQVTKFERLGNYVIPFYLWPGKYTLVARNQGVEVFSRDVDLTRHDLEDIDLVRAGASTRPATQPGTESSTQPIAPI